MILIVAEKPSVGRVIASVVGAKERHDGYMQGNDYIVSWCLGRGYEVRKRWDVDVGAGSRCERKGTLALRIFFHVICSQ